MNINMKTKTLNMHQCIEGKSLSQRPPYLLLQKKEKQTTMEYSQTIFFLLFQDHVHVSVTQKIIQLRNSTCET